MTTSTTLVYADKAKHLKPFLGIAATNVSQDGLLDMLLSLACSKINDMLNVTTLAKHVVTDEIVAGGSSIIEVKDFPILSVQSIKQGSQNALYTQTAPYILEKNRILLDGVAGGGTGYEANKVSYTAGYVTYNQSLLGDYAGEAVTLPDQILQITLLLTAGLYAKRKNPSVKSYTLQGKSVTFRDESEFVEFESTLNHYKKNTKLTNSYI